MIINNINDIDDDFAIIQNKDLSRLCGTILSGRQYKKICQQVKLIVKNLRSKNPEFIEHFLTKVENNSLLLGLENASKNTQKLALKAMTLSYKSGAEKAAKAFAKEGIILLPN